MHIDYEKLMPIGIKILIIIAAALLLYFIGIPIIKVLLPFIIATFVAILIEPQVNFFQRKFRMGRKFSSFTSLVFSLVVFGTIIVLIFYKIIVELITLSSKINDYFQSFNLNNEVNYWTNLSQKFYLSIPPEAANLFQDRLNDTYNTFSNYVSNFIQSTLSFVLGFVKVLPESFVFILITIIATYFISSDKDRIRNFLFKQIPDSWKPKMVRLKSDLVFAFIGFLKAQIIIISISILIASTGFIIIDIKYAILMGIIVGLGELIPVVGTGLIFVPWITYEVINQDIFIAIQLFAVFIVGVIARQMIEPKIIGTQIGLYPLVTLIAIYVGLQLFGIFGMLLGPIIVILVKNINKSGIITLWKE